MMPKAIVLWILVFCTSSFLVHAQEEGVWNIALDSLLVKTNRNTSAINMGGDGKISWNMRRLETMPMILGHADPVRYAQMLPGIQTNDEYSTGLHIQGNANQHNQVQSGGVPLYNISHLMGFFSTFIPSHYHSMELAKSVSSTEMSNRLGGELTMVLPDSIPRKVNGKLSLGLISSHGTLHLPIGKSTGITLSLRGSYLNLLYGRWLKSGDHQLNYSFMDANYTILHRLNTHNLLIFDGYLGKDNGNFFDPSYVANMKSSWGNRMTALHWKYDNIRGLRMTNILYITQYHNQFQLNMPEMQFRLPSRITDWGYKCHVKWNRWHVGAEVVKHIIKLQTLERMGTYQESSDYTPIERPIEISLYGEYNKPLSEYIKITGGIRASLFHNTSINYHGIDPFFNFYYANSNVQFSMTVSRKHQYLFQTGFSDMGLPTEFWMPAKEELCPQTANAINVTYNHYLLNRKFRLTADFFYKKLKGQVEYIGSVLDLMNRVYDVDGLLLLCNGKNYGCGIALNKCSGSITGWICYSYTHAFNTFQDYGQNDAFPANHSRPHEVNAVVSYSLNSHWNFGISMVYGTGTPFTAAESLSLLNGNILIKYGKHNGTRLSPYSRIDISVNYKWTNKTFKEQGLNFSLYNLTSHDNEVFYYLRSHRDGQFAYNPVVSILKVLPSLSYYCKF